MTGARETERDRSAAAERPRFDLRFDGGRGLLRLARPLGCELGEVEALELALGPVKFPLDVASGAGRFRTRRTRVRTARLRVPFRALERLAAARGVKLAVTGGLASAAESGGMAAVHLAIADEVGTVACEAMVVADGGDLVIAVRDARSAVDAPASADARIARAARQVGLVLDEERGVWRVPRPARRIFAEALVARGWRLPDERGVELAPPRVEGGALLLPLGLRTAEEPGRLAADAASLEDARELRLVTVALASGDADAADRALRVAERRFADRPGLSGAVAAQARRRLGAMRAVLATEPRPDDDLASVDAGAHARAAIDALGDGALARTLLLRLALRAEDAREAARAARAVAEIEPSADLAVEALAAAARLAAAGGSSRLAMELLARALGRRPERGDLAIALFAHARARSDRDSIETVAARALGAVRGDSERAAIARAAAVALERIGADDAAARWWSEAAAAAPDDADAIEGRARAEERAGEIERARESWDRAASLHVSPARTGGAARAAAARRESARLLAALGRLDAAEARLEEATRLDPASLAATVDLARVRVSIGAERDAAAAYRRLLAPEIAPVAPGLCEALVEAARFHLDRSADAEGARDFVEALLRIAPAHPEAAALRGRVEKVVVAAAVAAPDRIAEVVDAAPELLDGVAAEVDAIADPAERLERARRAAEALRSAGRAGDAALLLARAGAAARDAGLLRAAIELAERAGAWEAAARAVDLALGVVGEGPARVHLLERRAAIEARRSPR